jgi:hypothetical protein
MTDCEKVAGFPKRRHDLELVPEYCLLVGGCTLSTYRIYSIIRKFFARVRHGGFRTACGG